VPERMHGHALGQAWRGTGRTAGGVQHLDVDRRRLVPTGKQSVLGPGQTPVGAQDTQELGRQHDGAVLAAPRLRRGKLLPCSTRMTIRTLSISAIFRPTASDALSPAA
jgi:hypothetical protein